MSVDHLRYDILAQEALRGVVRRVLIDAAKKGLPGEHHFFISFNTLAPGVRISDRLRAQHPEEMTIVLQHQFWDLTVAEHAFEVGLSFKGVSERLLVPFTAVKSFFDPSVEFGLQFETAPRPGTVAEEPEIEEPAEAPTSLPAPAPRLVPAPAEAATAEGAKIQPTGGKAEVVSLDAFRKK